MTELKTQILGNDQNGLEQAADILSRGGLVAFPTETVYGLGADACNGHAVASVYAAKGRPSFNPLIVHVADLETAQRFAQLNAIALNLASVFWPGPVSLVLPLAKDHGLSDLVTAGLDTVAIRIPAHKTAQGLLKAFGGALAAPSANPSGRISPTSADHVAGDMNGMIDAVVDGGACQVGIESTILKVDGEQVALLRAGGLPVEAVEACLGGPIAKPQDPDTPQSPGQLQSHYAPNAAVRLNATFAKDHEVLLGFGPNAHNAALNLSPTGDMIEAATNLFAYMRDIDRIAGADKSIAISPVPMSGLGLAINDRLNRAAAPRS